MDSKIRQEHVMVESSVFNTTVAPCSDCIYLTNNVKFVPVGSINSQDNVKVHYNKKNIMSAVQIYHIFTSLGTSFSTNPTCAICCSSSPRPPSTTSMSSEHGCSMGAGDGTPDVEAPGSSMEAG